MRTEGGGRRSEDGGPETGVRLYCPASRRRVALRHFLIDWSLAPGHWPSSFRTSDLLHLTVLFVRHDPGPAFLPAPLLTSYI